MVEALAESEEIADSEEEGGVAAVVAGDFLGDGDVGAGVERGQEVELLKNESDLALAQAGAFGVGECGEVVAVEDYFAGIGAGESAEEVEECGFAAAGGADDSYEFSSLYGEGDAAEGGDVDFSDAIGFVQINGFDESGHALVEFTRWVGRPLRAGVSITCTG